jgi:hypothetical protein
MKKYLMALALAMAVPGGAFAADMPLKAPAYNLPNVYPTKACGWFYGLNAEGGAGVVNGAPAGTVAIGGDIGVLVGYACPLASIPFFFQADFDFQNLNAGNAGFSLNGPAHFTQLAAVQTPLLSWFSSWINVGQNNIPSIVPLLPPGVTVNGPPQNYFGVTVSEDDVSASYGGMTARDWVVSPGVRTGLLFHLTGPNGVQAVGDVYAGLQFQSNAVCLGSFACPKLGERFVTGIEFKM